jgi:Ethanolamine utilization protein EutJ (predicted chaperonin)
VTAGRAYTVGIDVGTAFTAAATCRDGRAEVVTLGDRSDVIPSVAFLREDGLLLVGDAAERRAVSDPTRVARAFKRRIGDDVPLSLGGRPLTAEALTAAIVRRVVDFVTVREGGAPGRTVLTLPAGWRDHRRELLLAAAADAGVHQPELLAEPVAAAIHYAVRHELPPDAQVGIYDLGAGTFDATIVRRGDEGFEIVGRPQGDDHLGGIDLDALVWDHVEAVVGAPTLRPDGEPSPVLLRALAQVRAAAVDAKEALSYDTQALVPVAVPGLMTEVRLTRGEFEEMARPALLRTVDVLSRTCEAAHVAPAELHAVLLVGGSSRIPMIGQLIAHELGARVVYDAHPKLATCLGAARAAATCGWATAAPTGPPAAGRAGDGAEDGLAEPAAEAPLPDAEGPERGAEAREPETAAQEAAASGGGSPPPPETAEVDVTGAETGDDDGPQPGGPRAETGGDEPAPSRRRALAAIALATLVVAAALGLVLTRDQPRDAAGADDEGARTTTTSTAAPTTSTTVADTTTTTGDTASAAPPSGDDATPASGPSQAPAATTTTTPPTTTTTQPPAPGSPCDPAAGDPDCTNESADGTFRIVSGYADCVATLGEGGLCSDLDGDGVAGFPDSS